MVPAGGCTAASQAHASVSSLASSVAALMADVLIIHSLRFIILLRLPFANQVKCFLMKRVVAALLILASLLYSQGKKRKSPKPPDLTMMKVDARRTDMGISIDGKVKNTGEKTLNGVVLLIDFLAPGKEVLTTKNGPVEAEALAPGEEADFRLQINDQNRAVHIRFNAEDKDKRDLRVENAGPFTIE